MQHLFALVEVLDELGDAAGIEVFGGLNGIVALVGEGDFEALVQEGELAKAVGEGIVIKDLCFHDGDVGFEGDPRTGLAPGFASFSQGSFRDAAGIFLLPGEPVTPDFQFQLFGKRVDAAYTDAVQPAGDFVTLGIEFAAGVQHGHDHLRGGNTLLFVKIHRNAAAVVDHGDGVIVVDDDVDFGSVAGHGFIHRVVDYFVDQVMEAHFPGGTDIHGGAEPYCLQTFQNLDTTGIVYLLGTGGIYFVCHRTRIRSSWA